MVGHGTAPSTMVGSGTAPGTKVGSRTALQTKCCLQQGVSRVGFQCGWCTKNIDDESDGLHQKL